jgi:uncharacterized membrane protein YgcG
MEPRVKKAGLLWLSLIFSGSFGMAQDNVKSIWVTHPILVDGNSSDWSNGLHYYDDGTQLLYAIANDSLNLYLCFQEVDEAKQMRIMRTGITITVGLKGKPKVKADLTFPPKDQEHVRFSEQDRGQRPDISQLHSNFIMDHAMMSIKGFAAPDCDVMMNNKTGIVAALNWDPNNRMNFEVAIPWKQLQRSFSAAAIKEVISLQASINAAAQRANNGGSQGNGSRAGGAGRGGYGGGMQGGGGGGGRQGRGQRGGNMQNGGPNNTTRGDWFTPLSFKKEFHAAPGQ